MNEQITIKVFPVTMVVVDGRESEARLWYQAPGLDIYVWGAVTVKREHAVHYLAVENAIARHIPASSLRTVRAIRIKPVRIDANKKRMF